MKQAKDSLRIVVKVGTSTLTRENGIANLHNMDLLARILSDLSGMGHEVILVTSGAIGIGAGKLRLGERPTELRKKQAAAAVGQCEMMHLYDKFVLGDSDTLSAIVARLCGADLLVLLSDIDGLYDADPRSNPNAKLIHQVSAITPELRQMAGGAGTWRGTGGMATKLNAAEIAMRAGVEMVITNGARMDALYEIDAGQDVGTRFLAQETEG